MMGGVSAPTLIFGAAAAVVLFVDVVYGKNLLRHDVSPAPPPPTVGISYMHPFGSSSSSSSNIGRSITRSMPRPPYHYYSVGSRRHLEIGESAKEELVRALQEDHQVTVVGPVEGGNVLCDSLVAAENATTLPFSLHEGEVIVAERLAYFATKNGDVFTDGMARKVWLGAVTHPPQGEGETVAWRVSMAWGEECDPETFLLKTTRRYTDGTTGITKTVPCGGSATHTCMVQLLVDFDDPGEELFQAGVMAGGTNIFSNAPTDSTRGLGGVAGNQPGRTYPLTRKIFSDLGLEEPTDTVVDVMVLYSAKSLTAMGNVSPEQMETIIYESLAWTNQAFVNSRVSVRFNPVRIGQLPYEETSLDGKGTLSNLRQNEDVASLRDATGADLVQMVGHFTDGACGWGDVYTGDEALGFSLVKATCLDNHAHTHEFGRNLGCRDDRESTGVETGRGHGLHYCDGPSPYRTIMSHSCGSPVVNNFSNPAVSYVGRPTGTTEQDNAGVIEENMVDVSNFRDRAAPPPSGPPSTIVTPLRTALRSAKASTSASSASASQINALSPSTKRRPRFLQVEPTRPRPSTG